METDKEKAKGIIESLTFLHNLLFVDESPKQLNINYQDNSSLLVVEYIDHPEKDRFVVPRSIDDEFQKMIWEMHFRIFCKKN